MITYLFTDTKNKQHSIAEYEGAQVQYWQMLFSEYTQAEVEAFIKAEALLKLGRVDEIPDLIEPFVSGENTIQTTNEPQVDENGDPVLAEDGSQIFKTIITGADTRSFMKKWQDENL
jgi:hypothetical protein